jgi:hypothetical protein
LWGLNKHFKTGTLRRLHHFLTESRSHDLMLVDVTCDPGKDSPFDHGGCRASLGRDIHWKPVFEPLVLKPLRYHNLDTLRGENEKNWKKKRRGPSMTVTYHAEYSCRKIFRCQFHQRKAQICRKAYFCAIQFHQKILCPTLSLHSI